MEQRLALLHTSPVLVPTFDALCKSQLPDLPRFHVVDESLIRNTIAAGRLEKSTVRRLITQVGSALDAGATAVFVTCSSIGPAVATARQVFDQPLFRIDEAMASKAVSLGTRVGVLATLRTTLEPTVRLIVDTAEAAGARCEVIDRLCDGAFEAVLAGNNATHDELVREGLFHLSSQVDVVVLAQASMARVLAELPPGQITVPVLSSPALAIQQIQEKLYGPRAVL